MIQTTQVIDRREPAPGIVILGLHAPALVPACRPGHFVMAISPAGVQAAVALGVYEARDERVSLMLVEAGPRTRALAGLAPGDTLELLAPLGNGFFLDDLPEHVGIVAGGVGLASVLLAAEEIVKRGKRATLYYGARTARALVDRDLFAAAGCAIECATDDGTYGHHGYVTDLLRTGDVPSMLLACGPSPMLRSLARVAGERGLRAQLSLEETFACGVGACWGCVVPIDRASAQAPKFPEAGADESRSYVHARICKEGPVFWAHELRW
jgi:dihydroorotate dehydrogenase electron transfer subunit